MNELFSILNASDRVAQTESNFERLDRSLAFSLNPTLVDGVPNVLIGPPTTGEWYAGKLWVDSLCGVFRCTVAGTPGTWQQVQPAFVAANPVGAPDDYWIVRTDQHFTAYYYNLGGPTWTAI